MLIGEFKQGVHAKRGFALKAWNRGWRFSSLQSFPYRYRQRRSNRPEHSLENPPTLAEAWTFVWNICFTQSKCSMGSPTRNSPVSRFRFQFAAPLLSHCSRRIGDVHSGSRLLLRWGADFAGLCRILPREVLDFLCTNAIPRIARFGAHLQ